MTDFGRRVGDMLKSVYDSDNDGSITVMHTQANMETSTYDPEVTGIVADARKLEQSTKAQVRDHEPRSHEHTESDISDLDAAIYAIVALHAALPSAHHARYTDAAVDAIVATHAALPNVHHTPAAAAGGDKVMLALGYESVIQGTWVVFGPADSLYVGILYNSPAADGDGLRFAAQMAAGTYTLLFISHHVGDSGVLDVFIDDVEVASFDCYAAPAVANFRNEQEGIVIAEAGLKTVDFIVDGKNASSTSYLCRFLYAELYRTA